MRALIVLPDENAPGLTDAQRLGLTIRNNASIDGQCACGARRVLPNRAQRRAAKAEGRVMVAPLEHEHDCPAVSPDVEQLADRVRFKYAVIELPERAV